MSRMAKVSPKGWITIPRPLREKYGLRPGTQVRFIEYAGALFLVPVPRDAIAEGRGVLRQFGGPAEWTEALLEERKRERAKEEEGLERWLHP